jgi:hypothetical protein
MSEGCFGVRSPRAAVVIGLSALLIGLAYLATPAIAGTQGQQVYIYAPFERSVQICGPNQNYQYTHQSVCAAADVRSSPLLYFPKWWWNGTVSIRNYSSYGEQPGSYLGTNNCQVPTVQNADWFGCVGLFSPQYVRLRVTVSGRHVVRKVRYPYYQRFPNLGSKIFFVLSPFWVYDPFFRRYVDRTYTFGYWDGHYVYKITDSVGIDINTGELVIAQTTNHWIVAGSAVTAGRACLQGLPGVPIPEKAAITAWCGVGGAALSFLTPSP